MKKLFSKIKYVVLVLVLWFISHVVITVYYGLGTCANNANVAIVLGNKVNSDSTLSPRLKARMDEVLRLYNNKQVECVVVSGGTGKEGVNEATEMKKYLLDNLVPEKFVLIDTMGNTTMLTAVNTFDICNKHERGFQSAIVVSQYYHLLRCKLIFDRVSLEEIYVSAPRYYEIRDLYALFREFFAFYYYLVFK